MRSISARAKYPADSFAVAGMAYVGTGTCTTGPTVDSISNQPSRDAVTRPRWISRTSPLARTTVIADTQARVEPYLKVAAPAALVAMVPPTNAPSKVGTGG